MKTYFFIVIFGVLGLLSIYTYDRFSYADDPVYFESPVSDDTLLKIGIIGDSWVYDHKLDSMLNIQLSLKGIHCNIFSSGHPGAKSKLIYESLFTSDKYIIEKKPKFCIVVAGVNDALGQVGKNFYAYHTTLIIKTLLHYKIKPVLLELPQFGIIEQTNEMNPLKRLRNKVFSLLNNSGNIDNISNYRFALQEQLNKTQLKDSIIFISYDSICPKYGKCPELYINPSHLSDVGKNNLAFEIAKSLKY